tara:strand:+ start:123 stop:1127 length:1005 start_codon:yes stop_codon:yes gene_type:complete
MSSLLEQAIIDASALREAAIKNAETAVLNKYSSDIKEAVESLLEEEEDFISAPSPEPGVESSSLEDSIPYGLQGPESSNEQEIVLSLEELKDMAEALSETDEDLIGEPSPHEDLANDIQDGPIPPSPEDQEASSVSVDATLEEEIDLEYLDQIIEELVVDIQPQKSGWAGTPEPIMNYKEEMELARRSSTTALAQVDALKSAAARLSEKQEKIEEKNAKLVKMLHSLKESFEKSQLSNAHLLYTNRILTNNSLNERQKNKIVEALSKTDSIQEAKVVFETLQSAVGSVSGKARSKSLRETIERPSVTLPRRTPRVESSPQSDRMQILAGIKKLK